MEKLLPIVPGCLAVTHNCSVQKNNGKTVIVGKFIGKVYDHIGERWEINRVLVNTAGEEIMHVQEAHLMRIDGGEFSHEKDSHELGIKA